MGEGTAFGGGQPQMPGMAEVSNKAEGVAHEVLTSTRSDTRADRSLPSGRSTFAEL